MLAGVAEHHREGVRCGSARRQSRGEHQPQGCKPRGRQIDEIVEACRRPAESEMARRFVADHAVGRVDRLVGDGAGQPGHRHPEQRRHDAIGDILGKAFDGGAADPRPRRGCAYRVRRSRSPPAGRLQRPRLRAPSPRPPRGNGHLRCARRTLPATPQNNNAAIRGSKCPAMQEIARPDPIPTMSSSKSSPTPRKRRWPNERASEFHARSHRAMSTPSQVTGWPIHR